MKLLIVLLLASTSLAQYSARYDRNGKMTGLFNLTEPVNCGLIKLTGPVREIRNADEHVFFSVRKVDVQLDLGAIANVDRANLYHFILKPRRRVEVTGYACGSNGVVDPVSIRIR